MSGAASRVAQLRTLRRLDDAERTAREALAADPQDAAVLTELAAVLLSAERHADGLAAADAAAALAPQDERVHRVRGVLLARLGRHTEALHAGYAAVSLAPNEPFAALGYATVLQIAGRLDDVELAPAEPAAHLRLADVASDRHDLVTARRAYAETLRLDPDNAAARHDLAVLDLQAHRPGDALRGLVEAGRMDPTQPLVLRNIAAVVWRLAWLLRIVLVVGVFVVIAAGGGDGATPSVPVRIGGALVLGVVAVASWRTLRNLPASTRPATLAAVRADRPLAFTCVALAVCVGLFGAVAVTGIGVVAVLVWLVLALLAIVAVVVGLARRRRTPS